MDIEVNGKKYEIVKNYKDALDKEDFISKCTEYFYDYDYIVGDIAYGKLRLKGFYEENSKKVKEYNNIKNVEKYIKKYCANDCKYFILKKKTNKL